MDKNKLHKLLKKGLIILAILIVTAVLAHLVMNYLVPFVVNMHNKGGAY